MYARPARRQHLRGLHPHAAPAQPQAHPGAERQRADTANQTAKTPELVRQEFWGLLLAHFAVRGLMHEAALRAAEDPDRLSFLHAVRVVRRKLPLFVALPPSVQACPA